ncbi:hypothetical protein BKA62DRAFT_712654 [Auriculariales sp. MPI-PUGE-AT-0066]|nr:hypothetical protein BKA62DRAFT_712654 [Auriculariales sp. MPI-PUGE-AT-0066]
MDMSASLPMELWLLVFGSRSELDSISLSRFSRTSRTNYSRWTPFLYHTIVIRSLNRYMRLGALAKSLNSVRRLWQRLMWRRHSPLRMTRVLRLLQSRDAMHRSRLISSGQYDDALCSILTACGSSLTILSLSMLAFNYDSLSRVMVARTCTVVQEAHPDNLHKHMACLWTWHKRDERLRGMRDQRGITPITHIVAVLRPTALDDQEVVTVFQQWALPTTVQKIVIVVSTPSLNVERDMEQNAGPTHLETKMNQLIKCIAEAIGRPTLMVIRKEVWNSSLPNDRDIGDRKWDELMRWGGNNFWENGQAMSERVDYE